MQIRQSRVRSNLFCWLLFVYISVSIAYSFKYNIWFIIFSSSLHLPMPVLYSHISVVNSNAIYTLLQAKIGIKQIIIEYRKVDDLKERRDGSI